MKDLVNQGNGCNCLGNSSYRIKSVRSILVLCIAQESDTMHSLAGNRSTCRPAAVDQHGKSGRINVH